MGIASRQYPAVGRWPEKKEERKCFICKRRLRLRSERAGEAKMLSPENPLKGGEEWAAAKPATIPATPPAL